MYRDTEGNVFTGTYENHHKDGFGIMKYAKGYNIEGTWQHGLLTGYAKIIFPNNGTVCDAKFGQNGVELSRGPCV